MLLHHGNPNGSNLHNRICEALVRVLLIGGSGFIGSFAVQALQQEGHSVTVFHRGTRALPPRVQEIVGDRNQLTANAEQLRRCRFDIVVDLVASSRKQAESLMNVFHGATTRLVVLSSIDVYRGATVPDSKTTNDLCPVPLTEQSELRQGPPLLLARHLRELFPWIADEYDKVGVESVVMSDPKLPTTVLRLPVVYGPGDRLHRLHNIMRQILDGCQTIFLCNKLAARRVSRVYAGNVAAAIALVIKTNRSETQIYNVSDQPSLNNLEWASTIAEQMGYKGTFEVVSAESMPNIISIGDNFSHHVVVSSARIREDLGYFEHEPIEGAIRKTVQWELRHLHKS